jgi:hypothetical protein
VAWWQWAIRGHASIRRHRCCAARGCLVAAWHRNVEAGRGRLSSAKLNESPKWDHAFFAVCCALRGLQTTNFRGAVDDGPGMLRPAAVPTAFSGRLVQYVVQYGCVGEPLRLLGLRYLAAVRVRRAAACATRARYCHWFNWPDQMRRNCICRSIAPADRMFRLPLGPSRRPTDHSTQPVTPDI